MEELIESILDYIRRDYTDYAIMINGEWGSGKTHFWNNKIKNKIESLELNGKRYQTIYMSLYGISNLEEISKKLFIETTQLMDKNLKRYMNNNKETHIPEYAKTGLNMANLFGLNQMGERMDYSKFFATDDKVLCFDDLERANVDVIDVLGYINNYVEHDHIKTIIICNEKELATKLKNSNVEMKTFIATYILDKEGKLTEKSEKLEKPIVDLIQDKVEYIFDKANDYERIKEKLIGETFEYIPEFSYIINGLLLRYEDNRELIQFLRKNSSIITSTFNRTGTRNLRVLKHALNDFSKIFESIKKHYPATDEKHLKTILIFTIAISFEIKAGKVSKNKFNTINSNEEYNTLLVASKILDNSKQFYIREFDSNYFYNVKSEFKFFKFVEIYVRTRIFDMKVFKNDMDKLTDLSSKNVRVPAYKRLLTEEYWTIEDEEFNLMVLETLQDVKAGKLNLPDYVKLFIYFSYFVKRKLIDEDLRNLKIMFINGMNIASLHSTYMENIENEIEKIGIEVDNNELEDILKHFNVINEQLKERMYVEKAEELFKLVPTNMEIFFDLFYKKYRQIPIFKYYDMYRLFEQMLALSNEHIASFKDLLIERYSKSEDVNKMLEPEIKNFRLLKQVIDDYVRGKIITIKIVLLNEISKELENILMKYKNNFFGA